MSVGAEGVIIVASDLVVHTLEREKTQSEQLSKVSVYAQHKSDNERKQESRQKT